jgi:hypothetical protein
MLRKSFPNFPVGRKAEGQGWQSRLHHFYFLRLSSSVFLFQFVVVRRAEQQQLRFRFVLFFVRVAKAGAPPFVVVLFFLCAILLMFWKNREI